MNCTCELVTRKSAKTGKEYQVLEITFPNGYKKTVFLEYAELFMLSDIVNN